MQNLSPAASPPSGSPATGYRLWELVAYMLRLGTLGFGGPVALVGYMYRDLVEKRHWISESDYKEGMALAQLMPGPLAAQLAIYLGYVHYRVRGATLVGLAFVWGEAERPTLVRRGVRVRRLRGSHRGREQYERKQPEGDTRAEQAEPARNCYWVRY